MTIRLYFDDAYRHRFEATLLDQQEDNGRFAVELDQTCFYPESGGQPHDLGHINGVPVLDVTVRSADEAILHWLPQRLQTNSVTGVVDGARRFDHMQQHTGQHILSQAFQRVAAAGTVSFHLGTETVTIDLDTETLPATVQDEAELLANEVVWQNRPVAARLVTRSEAAKLGLRGQPAHVAGDRLRLVEIEAFDLTACGGTHVARSGDIGLIKLLKTERLRRMWRVHFACGRRALAQVQARHAVTQLLTRRLTTGLDGLEPAVARLQSALKEAERDARREGQRRLQLEADQLLAPGENAPGPRVITRVFAGREPGELRTLAGMLTAGPGVVALLGVAGEKSFLLFSRSADAAGEMDALLQPALAALGGRGGGTAATAQGGGPAATEAAVAAVLATARQQLA